MLPPRDELRSILDDFKAMRLGHVATLKDLITYEERWSCKILPWECETTAGERPLTMALTKDALPFLDQPPAHWLRALKRAEERERPSGAPSRER